MAKQQAPKAEPEVEGTTPATEAEPEVQAPVKSAEVEIAPGLKVPADMLEAVREYALAHPEQKVVIVSVGKTQVVFEADFSPLKLTVRQAE